MADADVDRFAFRLEAHRAAETTAFMDHRGLLKRTSFIRSRQHFGRRVNAAR
jgi:hypothetical protein